MHTNHKKDLIDFFKLLIESCRVKGHSEFANLANRCGTVQYFLTLKPIKPAGKLFRSECIKSLAILITKKLRSEERTSGWVEEIKELVKFFTACKSCCTIWNECMDEFFRCQPNYNEMINYLNVPEPHFWNSLRKYMSRLQQKDYYSGFHCYDVGIRVTKFIDKCDKVRELLGNEYPHNFKKINSFEKGSILYGAILHDIGKVHVPRSVLLKPDKLTEEEWKAMKKHASPRGILAKKIKELDRVFDRPFLRSSCRVHHQHWKIPKYGYPCLKKQERDSLMGWIVAVEDNVSAMMTDRVYRCAYSKQKTFLEMEESNKKGKFHPDIYRFWREYWMNAENEKQEENQL